MITKKEILSFLRKESVMSIAVCAENNPISSVVLFAVDDNFNFFFVTKNDSFKAKALLKNNNISFSVWKHNEMLIQAKGQTKVLRDSKLNQVLDMLADSVTNIENFWPPILAIEGGDYVVFRIKLDWLRVMDLKNLKITQKEPFMKEVIL